MGIQPDLSRFKRNIMKTLAILACLLALSYAAEKTAEQEQSAQLVEPVDQLPEEQRYGGYGGHRYGGHYGGHGGHRYGRSVADETQELEVEEQRYGGYRGGYGGHRYGRSVHRYGRSVADETQELEGQEQRYGGYRGGYWSPLWP